MDSSKPLVIAGNSKEDVIFCSCGLPLRIDGSCKRKHKPRIARKGRFSGKSKRMFGAYERF